MKCTMYVKMLLVFEIFSWISKNRRKRKRKKFKHCGFSLIFQGGKTEHFYEIIVQFQLKTHDFLTSFFVGVSRNCLVSEDLGNWVEWNVVD